MKVHLLELHVPLRDFGTSGNGDDGAPGLWIFHAESWVYGDGGSIGKFNDRILVYIARESAAFETNLLAGTYALFARTETHTGRLW